MCKESSFYMYNLKTCDKVRQNSKGPNLGLFSYRCRKEHSASMLEKDITAAIMRMLKMVPRCFAWKEHGGMYGTAGIPDVICCLDGRFFAFEVKAPDGVVTKLQERTIHRIKVAGGHAYVVRSVDDVKAVLWAYAGIDI